jgi:hypothetical protein
MGFKVFTIYEYRLQDLNSIIVCLCETVTRNKKIGIKTNNIEMTINELKKLLEMIINRM